MSKNEMKAVVGGEVTGMSCTITCDNGGYSIGNHCPDDGEDSDYCYEGGVIITCHCDYA